MEALVGNGCYGVIGMISGGVGNGRAAALIEWAM
jgi:hypothetical protein